MLRSQSRGRRVLKAVFIVLSVAVLSVGSALLYHLLVPRHFVIDGEKVLLNLSGGELVCPAFKNAASPSEGPQGIVVLATGDGGWSYWENNTAEFLSRQGFVVIGWDCRKFADSRKYDQAALAEGFNRAVLAANELAGKSNLPVWYAGWSTGAEQAVAAAASTNCNSQVVGLLLAAPGERGRYGLTTSDLLGIKPTGDDTFALSDFGDKLRGIHIAQFAAGLDPLDDIGWLDTLESPHKLYELPDTLHDMGGAGEEFLAKLKEAIAWTRGSSAK